MRTRIAPRLLLCLCLSLPVAAQAEVKDVAANGFTIENSAQVPVPADVAWAALVQDIGQWWPADHTWWGEAGALSLEAVAGGCFCERQGARQARHMAVVFADPPRLLRLVGGLGPLQGMGLDGVMEFRLAPAEGGGTTITLWYRAGGYVPEDISGFVPVVDRVQAQQLDGLVQYLRARAGAADSGADQ